MGCPIGNLALELSDDLPRIRALIDANFRGWTAGVQRWLDEAGDRLPAGTDTAALAEFVLTVMEGGLMGAWLALLTWFTLYAVGMTWLFLKYKWEAVRI